MGPILVIWIGPYTSNMDYILEIWVLRILVIWFIYQKYGSYTSNMDYILEIWVLY